MAKTTKKQAPVIEEEPKTSDTIRAAMEAGASFVLDEDTNHAIVTLPEDFPAELRLALEREKAIRVVAPDSFEMQAEAVKHEKAITPPVAAQAAREPAFSILAGGFALASATSRETARALILECRRHGLTLELRGDLVDIRPPNRIPLVLRHRLHQHAHAVVAELERNG